MKCLLLIIGSLLPIASVAEAWEFGDKVPVIRKQGENVFHHLDANGRRHIAVSADRVAIVWEDNHNGSPQVYMASKAVNDTVFTAAVKLSRGENAFAPVIIADQARGYLLGWEEDDAIVIAHTVDGTIHKSIQLCERQCRQLSLLSIDKSQVLAAWVDGSGRFSRVYTSLIQLDTNGNPVEVLTSHAVDPEMPKDNQLYPVLAKADGVITLVWEDRRNGHTMLLYSQSKEGKKFGPFVLLNEVVQKSKTYGQGSGVTRVVLANTGRQGLAAAWMDKRNHSTGYDVYAAVINNNTHQFGKNQQVQDSFGNNIAQWNPAISGNPQGDVVIAWDDNRDETSDIWLSWKTVQGWSEDIPLEPASGDQEQFGAVIVFDEQRNLHIAWLEQDKRFTPTRLYYTVGKYRP